MKTEQICNNNTEKIQKENTSSKEITKENKIEKPKFDKSEENIEKKANIEMRKENKNKKRKKIKIRAYCGKCYQFFENGPYSKICRNHLEKTCNLIECQKNKQNGENLCIRKFTNINSANRHTHCLTKNEIENWDSNCEIQKCLGKKTEPDNKFLDVLNNNNNIFSGINKNNKSFCSELNNSLNLNFNNTTNFFIDKHDYFFDTISKNSNNSNNNVLGLIEDIDKLEKEINKKFEKMNINEGKKESPSLENESIDNFFDKVQKETNIPNNIKKKLVNAFRKKGIFNVKILNLFYEKYKNWDFLIQKFKSVTPQIEGVALCIEFLLKKN